MARKKKNDANPLALLLAIPVAIFMFFREHIGLAIVFAIVLIAAIIAIIAAKKAKREAYLRWYYDRDRRIAELNINNKFDVDLTNAILKAQANGTTVSIGKTSPSFDCVKEEYARMVQSNEILHGTDKLYSNDSSRTLNSNFGINAISEPLILRYVGENNGGYVFYVFSEVILAFVEGPEQVVFLAAYKPEVLNISGKSLEVRKDDIIVQDKSQNPIRYYDSYCPVKDAEIISSGWKVENLNGARSFRGGLLPDNNPLHFILRYAKLTFAIGGYAMQTSYSRYKTAMDFVTAHENYKKTLDTPNTDISTAKALTETLREIVSQNTPEPTFSTDASFVSYSLANVAPTPTSSKIKNPISVDDARYRNRMVANNISKELNHLYYGQQEFKVYQVRKDRDDWKMQDAGVYTYISDNGTQYCIEFDIRTNLIDGTTNLEFFVWCDNADFVQKKFERIITENNMIPKGNGFSIIFPNDYQGNECAMSAELLEQVKALFFSISNLS